MSTKVSKLRPASPAAAPELGLNLRPWDWLHALSHDIEALPARSGERTRLRLVRGAAELIAHSDKPLRPSAINRQAHTAQGTFYAYFDDATQVEKAVVELLLQFRASKLPVLPAQNDPFTAICHFIDAYARVYAANARLFQGVMDRVNHDPALAQVRQSYNSALIDSIKADIRRRGASNKLTDRTLELSIWVAGTMLEDTLYATLGSGRSPRGLELAGGLEGLVEVTATMFYRALYTAPTGDIAVKALPDLRALGLKG